MQMASTHKNHTLCVHENADCKLPTLLVLHLSKLGIIMPQSSCYNYYACKDLLIIGKYVLLLLVDVWGVSEGLLQFLHPLPLSSLPLLGPQSILGIPLLHLNNTDDSTYTFIQQHHSGGKVSFASSVYNQQLTSCSVQGTFTDCFKMRQCMQKYIYIQRETLCTGLHIGTCKFLCKISFPPYT